MDYRYSVRIAYCVTIGYELHEGSEGMSGIVQYLIPILLACVLAILALGLWNMMQGGSANRSQTLMRMRILFQFIAIAVVMVIFYFAAQD
jgi:hypothetical protein